MVCQWNGAKRKGNAPPVADSPAESGRMGAAGMKPAALPTGTKEKPVMSLCTSATFLSFTLKNLIFYSIFVKFCEKKQYLEPEMSSG